MRTPNAEPQLAMLARDVGPKQHQRRCRCILPGSAFLQEHLASRCRRTLPYLINNVEISAPQGFKKYMPWGARVTKRTKCSQGTVLQLFRRRVAQSAGRRGPASYFSPRGIARAETPSFVGGNREAAVPKNHHTYT